MQADNIFSMEISVFYTKTGAIGSIEVSEKDTFATVKQKIIQKYSDENSEDELIYSACSIEFPQPCAKQRRRSNYTPFENSNVVEAVLNLDKICNIGKLCLAVVDMRRTSDSSVYISMSSEELLHEALLATSDEPEAYGEENSCTSWATTGYNAIGEGSAPSDSSTNSFNSTAASDRSDGTTMLVPWLFQSPSILDSLFSELSSTAVIQGRLQKKISNHRKQDIWR